MSLGLAPVNPDCRTTNVSAIVVLVEFTLVVVPLTVKLPPIVTSLEKAPVVAPLRAPPVKVAVPSVNVVDVTLVKPVKVASRFTVNVLPLPTVVMLVPVSYTHLTLPTK